MIDMTNKNPRLATNEVHEQIDQRANVLQELFITDGVPLNLTTAYALISLGIEYSVQASGIELTAKALEGWAYNVKHNIRRSEP